MMSLLLNERTGKRTGVKCSERAAQRDLSIFARKENFSSYCRARLLKWKSPPDSGCRPDSTVKKGEAGASPLNLAVMRDALYSSHSVEIPTRCGLISACENKAGGSCSFAVSDEPGISCSTKIALDGHNPAGAGPKLYHPPGRGSMGGGAIKG
jgi:hypothetical protein